ncbi:MFS general substrate transporter [Panus rudis PR-1116 ss-1]|nr:MFS general substrate transporter [Panus rudis PR-1116 ss-1]
MDSKDATCAMQTPTGTISYEMSNFPSEASSRIFNNGTTASLNSGEVNGQELPPVDRGTKAWMFCLSAFVLEAIVWGFGFSYGIFEAYYISHPPFNTAPHIAISAVGPIALAIQYAEGVFISLWLGRYPDYLKLTMWFGLVLCSLSLLLSSFVSQAWLLILLQGVCFGIGGGALYWPVMVLVSEWFVQRRGLAGGIIFAGSGIGGFVFPFIVNGLLDSVGMRWTLRTWALIEFVAGGLALLGVKSRTPTPKFRRGQPRPRFIPPRMQFLNKAVFWTYSATYLLQSMSFFPVSLYLAVFTTSFGSSLSATIVLALFNIAGVIGQIIMGYLSDLFPYPWIMFVSTLGSGIAAFTLWGFANTLTAVYAFSILFGGLAGGFSSVAFAAANDSANPNPEQAPMAMGAFTTVKGVAAVIGPIISGLLLNAGKSSSFGSYGKFGFGPVEIFVGSCAVASSITSLLVAATRPQMTT